MLQSLHDEPHLTRADLARRTGLTRVTISDIVAQLIADQLVTETGQTTTVRPGKPATMLTVRDDSRDIVAIDISAPDFIVGAICSPRGAERERVVVPLASATGQDAVDAVLELAATLVARSHNQLLGIGVGTPGIVDGDGVVLAAPNLAWHNLPLREHLEQRLGVLVAVENDANAAAMAEKSFADGPGDLMRVQISRGVGAGLLLDGQIVHGAFWAAGEIGHVVVEVDGDPCACGKRGCLETWASSPALTARIAAAPGHREAILDAAGQRLGVALAPVVAALDLTDIVLGGPASLLDGAFRDAARAHIVNVTESEFRKNVTLRLSPLDDRAVLLGAVALVRRLSLGVS